MQALMRLHVTLVAIGIFTFHGATRGQDLDKAGRALDVIEKFANGICNKPEMRGKSSSIEVQGTAKVEVSKLVKQLADLKIEGAAKFDTKDYEGLLQKDLLPALQESTRCKERIFNDLKDRFLPKVITQAAALTIQVDPDTVGIKVGSYVTVAYRFREANGTQATIDSQDIRWLLDNGIEIGSIKNMRVLGGSFVIPAKGSYTHWDNIYMPPDIAQKAFNAGYSQVQLEITFTAVDGENRKVHSRSVLRIGIIRA